MRKSEQRDSGHHQQFDALQPSAAQTPPRDKEPDIKQSIKINRSTPALLHHDESVLSQSTPTPVPSALNKPLAAMAEAKLPSSAPATTNSSRSDRLIEDYLALRSQEEDIEQELADLVVAGPPHRLLGVYTTNRSLRSKKICISLEPLLIPQTLREKGWKRAIGKDSTATRWRFCILRKANDLSTYL